MVRAVSSPEFCTDDQLIASAREHALVGLQMCVAVKGSLELRARVQRNFQNVLELIDASNQAKASPVTPEALGEDVISACALEGWDTTLTFWDYDNPRYDDEHDEELPSRAATDIARRLLEHYEMKPRT